MISTALDHRWSSPLRSAPLLYPAVGGPTGMRDRRKKILSPTAVARGALPIREPPAKSAAIRVRWSKGPQGFSTRFRKIQPLRPLASLTRIHSSVYERPESSVPASTE